MTHPLGNMEKLSNNMYVVRTQYGFRKAVADYAENDKELIATLEGYPASYPSVVTLYTGYKGYHYIYASCVHVKKRIDQLEHLLETLRKH